MRPLLMKSRILILFIMLTGVSMSLAQSNFSVSSGGGTIYYNGDLHDNNFLLPKTELFRSYFNVEVSMLLVDRLELSLGYMHGSIEGDDALSSNRYNRRRNLTFSSPIDEITMMLRLKLISHRSEEIINPYAMMGMGYFWFNPQTELDGKTYDLQPLGTEGQFIPGSGNPAPYNLSAASFAFGLGVQFRVNPYLGVRIEGYPRITFTDYLDDVSKSYPDSVSLAATPNGALATMLSSRSEKGFPEAGRSRGNNNKNDVYMTFGASIVYTFKAGPNNAFSKPGVLNKSTRTKRGWRR